MRDSIHKYFKVGTLTWMSYPGAPQDEVLRKLAKDDYFDAVEICKCSDDASRENCKNILAQSHMLVGYGAHTRILGPKLNPNDLDEKKRLEAEETILEALDEAKYLGASGLAFLSGKYEEATKEESYKQLVKTTRAVCEKAKSLGMMVELEVFDYDVDKASLIGPAPYSAKFAEEICKEYDNFGLLVDLSHIPITHETSEFAIKTMAPYITHLHIGNAVLVPGAQAYGDKHPRFGFANGCNDEEELLNFLRVLKAEGFLREQNPMMLSFEVSPQPGEDPDIVLAGSKRVLNRAWALLED